MELPDYLKGIEVLVLSSFDCLLHDVFSELVNSFSLRGNVEYYWLSNSNMHRTLYCYYYIKYNFSI